MKEVSWIAHRPLQQVCYHFVSPRRPRTLCLRLLGVCRQRQTKPFEATGRLARYTRQDALDRGGTRKGVVRDVSKEQDFGTDGRPEGAYILLVAKSLSRRG